LSPSVFFSVVCAVLMKLDRAENDNGTKPEGIVPPLTNERVDYGWVS